MTTWKIISPLILVVLLIITGISYAKGFVSTKAPVPQASIEACSQEAKICPDGSSVGRSGPNCEFAACPADTAVRTVSVGLNGVVNVRGESIRPVTVTEDSRCPEGVQCIWAGTVKVTVIFITSTGDQTETITLGQSVQTKTQSIKLVSVTPSKVKDVELDKTKYVFTFEVTKL